MKTLTKLKMRRFVNRRSNGVVEQLEKLVSKLQAWISKLDQEMDEASLAMTQEINAIRENREREVERLTYAIAEAKQAALEAEALTTEQFEAIINEAKAESDRAKQVEVNMKKLVGSPD